MCDLLNLVCVFSQSDVQKMKLFRLNKIYLYSSIKYDGLIKIYDEFAMLNTIFICIQQVQSEMTGA